MIGTGPWGDLLRKSLLFAAAAPSKHADAVVVATVITLSVSETRQSTSLSVSFSDDALAGES